MAGPVTRRGLCEPAWSALLAPAWLSVPGRARFGVFAPGTSATGTVDSVMVELFREPSAGLAPFITRLWYVDEPLPAGRERVVPTGTMQLVVNLSADVLTWFGDVDGAAHRGPGAGLIGARTCPVIIDNAEQRASVGVAFRPGGTVPFFRPPANVLTDPVLALDDLWGRDGVVLRERLLDQPSPADVLSTLESVLVRQRARVQREMAPRSESSARIDPEIAAATVDLARGRPVGEVVGQASVAPRTFLRRFHSTVGMSPKAFARVRRVQRLLRQLNHSDVVPGAGSGTDGIDWAAVALDCGFYDQSHLINEFRAHVGLTPTAYRPREPNHIPIPEAHRVSESG